MGEICGAQQPDPEPAFLCTRKAGHDGPHETVLDPQFGRFEGLAAMWHDDQ
jgi:hypothetical protein